MAFTIYRASDAGAPTLNGQAGSLITVLNYILVGGQPNLITGSGNNAVGIAYGTTPSAGWTAGGWNTSTRAGYQLGTLGSGSSGCWLDINDNGPGAATYQEARAAGFMTMTAASTGTVQFPSIIQAQGIQNTPAYGYLAIRKSSAVSTTAKYWLAFADQLTLYLFIQSDSAGTYQGFYFGDIYSMAGASDSWRCMIAGRPYEGIATANYDAFDLCCGPAATIITLSNGYQAHFMPRTWSGGGLVISIGKHGDSAKITAATLTYTLGATGVQCVNGPDGCLYVSPIWITESVPILIRGIMRGFWHICHGTTNFTDGQVISGTGTYAGKTFMVVKASASAGCYLMETSNTLQQN